MQDFKESVFNCKVKLIFNLTEGNGKEKSKRGKRWKKRMGNYRAPMCESQRALLFYLRKWEKSSQCTPYTSLIVACNQTVLRLLFYWYREKEWAPNFTKRIRLEISDKLICYDFLSHTKSEDWISKSLHKILLK